MTQLQWLESFDRLADFPPQNDSQREAGYAQGVADTKAEHDADQHRLSSETAQAIADLQFNYVKALTELSRSFRPLLSAVVDQLLPVLVDAGFRLHVLEVLDKAAKESVAPNLQIAVHPAQRETLESMNEGRTPIDIIADETLALHAALVRYDAREAMVDLSSAASEIAEILSGIETIDARNATNE
jgi:hypothetical protein